MHIFFRDSFAVSIKSLKADIDPYSNNFRHSNLSNISDSAKKYSSVRTIYFLPRYCLASSNRRYILESNSDRQFFEIFPV